MFWTVVLCTAMWILGAIVGAFGLIQALICIRCGRLYTELLLFEGAISKQNASLVEKHYYLSAVVLIGLAAIVTVLVVLFINPPALWLYFAGIGIVLLFGIGRTGHNKANFEEYLDFVIKHGYLASEEANTLGRMPEFHH